jgi:putative nucleotidyltransferase with HDIG domain
MTQQDFRIGRGEALALLERYNESPRLRTHALCVEATMRAFAREAGEDVEKWGAIGLVHDLDYERWPEEHCTRSAALLAEAGWPTDWIRAVVSHGWGICSDAEPTLYMEKVLYATDELTGLIYATALMRPSRSILDLEAASVLKKWKDRRFAAGVDRALIEAGAERLGIPLETLVLRTIEAMREAADAIGLRGTPAGEA